MIPVAVLRSSGLKVSASRAKYGPIAVKKPA